MVSRPQLRHAGRGFAEGSPVQRGRVGPRLPLGAVALGPVLFDPSDASRHDDEAYIAKKAKLLSMNIKHPTWALTAAVTASLLGACTESNPAAGDSTIIIPRFGEAGTPRYDAMVRQRLTSDIGWDTRPDTDAGPSDGDLDEGANPRDADQDGDMRPNDLRSNDLRPDREATPRDLGADGDVFQWDVSLDHDVDPPTSSTTHLSLRSQRTTSLDLGDIDGDGQMDAVFGYAAGSYLGQMSGVANDVCFDIARSGFEKCRAIPEMTLGSGHRASQTTAIYLRDVNQDGLLDAVSFNRFVGLVHYGKRAANGAVDFGTGGAFFSDLSICKGIHGAVGDLDGNGTTDIASYQVWLGSPSSCSRSSGSSQSGALSYRTSFIETSNNFVRFGRPVALNIPPTDQGISLNVDIKIADLNGDNRDDIVVAGSPAQGIVWFKAQAAGGFAAAQTLPIAVRAWITHFDIDDVNQDGRLDILLTYNTASRPAQVYYGNDALTFSSVSHISGQGNEHRGIAAADLNGDGHNDLILVRMLHDPARDKPYFERVLVIPSAGPNADGTPVQIAETEGSTRQDFSGAIFGVTDFDQNGRDDLVLGLGNRLDRILINPLP